MSGKRRVYPQSEAMSSVSQPTGIPTQGENQQTPQPQPQAVPFFNVSNPQAPQGYPQPTQGYPQPTQGYPQPTEGYPQPSPLPAAQPSQAPLGPPPTSSPSVTSPSLHAQGGPRTYPDPEGQSSYTQPSGPIPAPLDPFAQVTSGVNQMNLGQSAQQGYPQGYPQPQQPVQGAYGAGQPQMGQEIPPTFSPSMRCPSLYMRTTLSHVPNTSALLNKSGIPFGAIIHPLAQPTTREERIPVVNFGTTGIIRCRRCRSYINPFVAFIEGGRRWKCNFCALPNDVPANYFSPLDQQGVRQDLENRPELLKGVVEFVAPAEYMVRPPMPPVYFFVIDVSYYSITSGMFHTTIETIKRIINDFPGHPRTRIGFLTFDSTLHFYNLKSSLSQPQMLVVTDIDDPFLPLPSDLLVNLADSRTIVEALLEKFPKMFQSTQNVESCLGIALKVAFNVIQHSGGKIIAFSSTLPSMGKGKLPNREDTKLLGTDRETNLLQPEDNYYKDFALDCSRQQITTDLFLFPPSFIDVATLGCVSQFTGGQVYYYPNFRSDRDGEKLYRDLIRNITRETGFEGVLRVRTSKSLKVQAHYGNFFIRSTDLLALPSMDADKAYGIQLALNDSTINTQHVSIQAALLYTTSKGERRIRVFTQCLPVTSLIYDLFQGADVEAITTITTKMAIEKALTSRLSDAREALVNKCIEILAVYKTDLATTGSSTSLLLPESLKLFPLYVLALVKNIIFRTGTDVRPDERTYNMMLMRFAPVYLTLPFIYPRLFALHNMPEEAGVVTEEGHVDLPPTVNLSSEKLDRAGAFLLEDGQSMYMWIGRACPPEFLSDVFGVTSLETVDTSQLKVERLENDLSSRIHVIIDELRGQRPNFMNLYVIREGEAAREAKFFSYFVEDRTKSVHSYYEFLVNLHQRILTKISAKR